MKTVLELEDLAKKAVKAALDQQWSDAIALNQEYLAENPQSIEALNRLARALQETGKTGDAKKTYQQVLGLDPYNTIAQKNLDKLNQGAKTSVSPVSSELFLEEPGKTRSASIQDANTTEINKYATGQQLQLVDHQGVLGLQIPQGAIIGTLETSLSTHLKKLLGLGNTYSAYLMLSSDTPKVFLRETHQSAAASNFVSFPKANSSQSPAGSIHRSRQLDLDASSDSLGAIEDDVDNWDSENADDSANLDDDFDSVSLEQMREDEDDNFKGSEY